jgi:hypothetical protein
MLIINIFSIILLISIIFVLFKNIYLYDNIEFITKKELKTILLNDNDNYYKTFTRKDLIVRNVKNVNEYKLIIKDSVCELNDSHKFKVRNAVKIADNKINKLIESNDGIYEGIDLLKLYNLKWKLGYICNNNYEEGLPHTRDDIIIMHVNDINNNNTKSIAETLVHEKVHVYQKTYKDDVDKYLNINNFKKIKTRANEDNIRANPDMDNSIYSDDTMIYSAKYLPNADSIKDVRLYKNDQKYEHPFENMAIKLADKCFI